MFTHPPRLTHWARNDDDGCDWLNSYCEIMTKRLNDQKSSKFYKIGLNLGVLYKKHDQF